ncbi:D-alanyl-D-alanine carboxypeptidase/D-alanyl-D-alanine-endopeptidase [candidate division KSB1 bacterium]|nr:D-alanyl-D-alanine carboxypeptidase/D-alanyl-D-alanine-endopeptidase [candidate division KSB1 bacterium]
MKFNLLKLLLILSILMLAFGCAPKAVKRQTISPVEKLAHQIEMQINEPDFESAIIGIAVQSLKTGEILFQHNANKVLMPASNEKIPTSAAALLKFGPNHTFKTKLYATGEIENGVLNGDLIVVAGGDPTIGYHDCEALDTCFVFQSWINALKEYGIKKINGDLIGVDDVFDDELIGYGWTYDDLSYSYSAQINGLIFNQNWSEVRFGMDSSGVLSQSVHPDLNYIHLFPNIEVADEESQKTRIKFQRFDYTNDVFFNGTMEPGDTYSRKISVHNPTLYFLRGFRRELEHFGISVSGESFDADELDSLEYYEEDLVHIHDSPPFSKILKTLMKESNNLYAESLVKLLGYHFGKEGSFKEGEDVIKSTLRRFGLAEDSYRYEDGSGLCRYNYISPNHIIKILRGMHYHKYGDVFKNSLPIAGVDGTIDYRMKGTVAQGKIFAKTGTISSVRCLSGYALSQDDEVLAFSIMVNNFLCSVHVVMDMQDRICMLLSSFSRN